jgi:hypothetical protein
MRENTEVWQYVVHRMNTEVFVSYMAIRLLQLVTNARPHWQTCGIRLVTACAGSFLRKSAAVYLLFM